MNEQKYDYNTMINRTKTGSVKWDEMKEWNPNVPQEVYPFSVADSDLRLAPEIIEGLQEFITNDLSLGYTHADEAYTSAVQNWMTKHHNFTPKAEWLVQTPGVVPAINFAIRALTREGDGIVIMPPVYYPFYDTIKHAKRHITESPLINQGTHYEIDFEHLEHKLKQPQNTMLVLCSPHNPVGRVWTREELEKIAELCIRYDVYLVSDEIHSDLILPGHKHTVMATISKEIEQQVAVCTAASKTFNIAGQCVSNIIIPNKEMRERFIAEKESYGIKTVSALGLATTKIAYERAGGWLDGFLELVVENHRVIKEFFAQNYPEVKVFDLEGTYLQWIDMRALGFGVSELEEFLNQEALDFFDQGYIFGPSGEGFERINLAASTESIRQMLDRFKEAMEQYQYQSQR